MHQVEGGFYALLRAIVGEIRLRHTFEQPLRYTFAILKLYSWFFSISLGIRLQLSTLFHSNEPTKNGIRSGNGRGVIHLW
jgi:hypothetical protein